MRIAVVGTQPMADEFAGRAFPAEVTFVYVQQIQEVPENADALFFLKPQGELAANRSHFEAFSGIVIANSVVHTLDSLPANTVRLNGWPGFVRREMVEVVAHAQNRTRAQDLFARLNWPCRFVADVPGMITPRVVAMLVNEAYFALGENISSRDQIDTAMKLGTNYPYGPFEWGQKIGLRHIVELLNTMAKADGRYAPAPLLIKESEL